MKHKLLLIIGILIFNMNVFAYTKNSCDKKGILLVTFGTTYLSAQKTFKNIEDEVKNKYPELDIRWAYTSKIIRKKLRQQGQKINSPAEALALMGEEGFTHVAVQSLHIIPGAEYDALEKTVLAFENMPKGIKRIELGKPLLYKHDDIEKIVSALNTIFHKQIVKNETIVFMGHGTHHNANIYYPGVQYYFSASSENLFLGTVEGYPTINDVIKLLKAKSVKTVVLTPFMSVAGDHAQNDMAGKDANSWKSILIKNGFSVKIIMKGFAEYNQVVDIWINHLQNALNKLEN